MDDDDFYQLQRRETALEKAEKMLFEKNHICDDLFDNLQIALNGKYDIEKTVEQNFLHASVSITRDYFSKKIMTGMRNAA